MNSILGGIVLKTGGGGYFFFSSSESLSSYAKRPLWFLFTLIMLAPLMRVRTLTFFAREISAISAFLFSTLRSKDF